jgi:hypothetical protein
MPTAPLGQRIGEWRALSSRIHMITTGLLMGFVALVLTIF